MNSAAPVVICRFKMRVGTYELLDDGERITVSCVQQSAGCEENAALLEKLLQIDFETWTASGVHSNAVGGQAAGAKIWVEGFGGEVAYLREPVEQKVGTIN